MCEVDALGDSSLGDASLHIDYDALLAPLAGVAAPVQDGEAAPGQELLIEGLSGLSLPLTRSSWPDEPRVATAATAPLRVDLPSSLGMEYGEGEADDADWSETAACSADSGHSEEERPPTIVARRRRGRGWQYCVMSSTGRPSWLGGNAILQSGVPELHEQLATLDMSALPGSFYMSLELRHAACRDVDRAPLPPGEEGLRRSKRARPLAAAWARATRGGGEATPAGVLERASAGSSSLTEPPTAERAKRLQRRGWEGWGDGCDADDEDADGASSAAGPAGFALPPRAGADGGARSPPCSDSPPQSPSDETEHLDMWGEWCAHAREGGANGLAEAETSAAEGGTTEGEEGEGEEEVVEEEERAAIARRDPFPKRARHGVERFVARPAPDPRVLHRTARLVAASGRCEGASEPRAADAPAVVARRRRGRGWQYCVVAPGAPSTWLSGAAIENSDNEALREILATIDLDALPDTVPERYAQHGSPPTRPVTPDAPPADGAAPEPDAYGLEALASRRGSHGAVGEGRDGRADASAGCDECGGGAGGGGSIEVAPVGRRDSSPVAAGAGGPGALWPDGLGPHGSEAEVSRLRAERDAARADARVAHAALAQAHGRIGALEAELAELRVLNRRK